MSGFHFKPQPLARLEIISINATESIDSKSKTVQLTQPSPHNISIQDNVELNMYPSLIIIGSVNGGTSLLNNLFSTHLKSFYNMGGLMDSFYWQKCRPCFDHNQLKQTKYDHTTWNASESNLCQVSTSNIQCNIKDYAKRVLHGHGDNYQTQRFNANKSTYYLAERCSVYIKFPYVAKILGTLFPKTILLYSIREQLSQQYSSNSVQKRLLPLLNNSNQTEEIRAEIVSWFILEHMEKRWQLKDHCPYILIITYMEILKNTNKEFGFSKLRLVQAEYLFEDALRASRFVHCIVHTNDESVHLEMTECMRYYKNNMNEILQPSSMKQLDNKDYLKKKAYKILWNDLDTFDKLASFQGICDQRLFELVMEYPYLIDGIEWNRNLWIDKRKKMRALVRTNSQQ
eukprot:439647_1